MDVVTPHGPAGRSARIILAAAIISFAMMVAFAACSGPAGREGPLGGICEVGTTCPGASAERCRDGQEARLYGRSAFDGQTCLAGDAANCARSRLTCKHFGQCAAPERPAAQRPARCAGVAIDPDQLAANDPACAGFGTCVANGDAPCRASGICALEGRCTSGGGVCIAANADDCRNSNHCGSIGWCQRVELDIGPRCRAVTDADCRASKTCANLGNCAAIAGECGACDKSEGCAQDGRCSRDGDRCIAATDADCRRSIACRSDGRCRALRGVCSR